MRDDKPMPSPGHPINLIPISAHTRRTFPFFLVYTETITVRITVTITGIDKISTLYSTGFIRVEFIKHDTCTLHRKTASVRVITVATAFNHDRSLVFRARRARETEQRLRGRRPASATYTLPASAARQKQTNTVPRRIHPQHPPRCRLEVK